MKNHLNIEIPLFERLKTAKKPILLYGMGNGADKILNAANDFALKIDGVFASDEFVRGQIYRGFKVLTYKQAKEKYGDIIILQAFGTNLSTVINKIKQIASVDEYYIPDMEVCGDLYFSNQIYEGLYQDLCQVYECLTDDRSKYVFDNLLLYKLSGKPEYLINSMDEEDPIYNEILKLKAEEVYVDVGAYDGDSIIEFLKFTKNFKHIYAFEPDSYNFKKLSKKWGNKDKITLYNSAASDKNDIITFNQLKGRQSSVSESGKQFVRAQKIDDIAPEATYIKFDVEGSEINALKGCVKTLKKNKPKLKVAAYHKNRDLLLPLLIKDIQPDYKVFIRNGRALPAWDLNYYFI